METKYCKHCEGCLVCETQPKNCLKCGNGQTLDTSTNTCVLIVINSEPQDNEATDAAACAEGYHYNEDKKTCEKVQDSWNCKTSKYYHVDQKIGCGSCKTDYVLDEGTNLCIAEAVGNYICFLTILIALIKLYT